MRGSANLHSRENRPQATGHGSEGDGTAERTGLGPQVSHMLGGTSSRLLELPASSICMRIILGRQLKAPAAGQGATGQHMPGSFWLKHRSSGNKYLLSGTTVPSKCFLARQSTRATSDVLSQCHPQASPLPSCSRTLQRLPETWLLPQQRGTETNCYDLLSTQSTCACPVVGTSLMCHNL